jgi:hypothetical protein
MRARPAIVTYAALVAVAALLAACAQSHAAPAPAQVRTNCFPASSWDASLKRLPCTTVVRPDNDRVRVIQGTTDAELAECVINTANLGDARCHRTARLRAADHVAVHVQPPGAVATCSPLHVCAAIGRTQEDGSVAVTIYVHMHRIEQCVLGNPREERNDYRSPCYPATANRAVRSYA